MPLIRWLSVVMFSFLLAACGGGGSIEKDGGSIDGDDTDTSAYTITVQGYTQNTTDESNSVTAEIPLEIVATVKNDGVAVSAQRVTFTLADDIGSLDPVSGSALTNSDGEASITLTAGTVEGAGEITATVTIGEVTENATFTFNSTGDGGDSSVVGTYALSLQIRDQSGATFSDENPVSKDNKGVVTATLTEDGAPLAGQLISFVSNFTGKITPELGTALTNESGEAKVTLSSGLLKGAGQIVATYQPENNDAISKTVGFISSGDDASVETAVANVDIKLLKGCDDDWDQNRNTASLESTYLTSGCTEVNQFSSEELIDVLVKVTDTSSGDGFAGIISETSTDLGSLLPDSGKALTDNFGFALLKLQPGANSGAGEITATSKSASSQKAFEIATADLTVTIDNGLYNKLDEGGNIIEGEFLPLAAGATTVITVKIFDTDGNLVVSPLDVEFTSGCVQNDLSVIDTSTTSISGVATATYRTNGCNAAQGDTVRATVLTGGTLIAEVNVPVSTAPIESIEFIDATESVIALKGTGGQGRSETSEITFKLKDKIGKEVQSNRIDFRLSSTNGGISLSDSSVFTDAEGLARVQVNAGFVPMSVRVQACYIPDEQIPENQTDNITCWQDVYLECQKDPADRGENVTCPTGELSLVSLDEQITTVSDLVSISSGLPDGNSFTAGAAIINIEALDYIGDLNEISVYLADHFNNPVPDGTAVYLTTEGGAVGTIDGEVFNPQLECRTVDGGCNAQWRSQNPKPFTEAKWGNQISSINPKTNTINCDLYFNSAAPCMAGILNAAFNDNGVPLGGRATVLVTAKGQESFIDINGNGLFDTNEYYSGYDLAEAFVDHNENGVYDGLAATYDPVTASVVNGAEFCQDGDENDPCSPENTNGGHFEEANFDIDLNGMHTLADGKYNGLLCTEGATMPTDDATFESLCTKDLIDVRDSFEIIMSGSTVYSRFVVLKTELQSVFAANLNEIERDEEEEPILDENGNSILTANAVQLALDIESCNSIYVTAGDISTEVVVDLEPTNETAYCDLGAINLSPNEVNSVEALSFSLYYSDRYNNPIPSGTNISISTDNGKYSGTDGFVMLESAATSAHSIPLSISRESEPNDSASGFLSIVFTTPKGVETTAQLAIRDAG
ncbi:hypothetical protein NQT69_02620 [Pseudoalteromonas shioyasakiensis]|uniref:hypothetical protein n=1 Tax=Pseudoalteromonas shioyasakiensis TaxID=1190813 RepID=UPI0021193F49|nr:hypothetical protein [Pseudoalteromonas shioyasakiensis]MCQ8876928.1 hypothetical protein [Pseudoalteromonas shioyasakiensis]